MSIARKFLLLPFWLAVLLAVLGYTITFAPGADCGWFLVVAGLSLAGLFIPKSAYRVGAALLFFLALASAYSGYRHGVEYRQWLTTRPSGTDERSTE